MMHAITSNSIALIIIVVSGLVLLVAMVIGRIAAAGQKSSHLPDTVDYKK